MKRSPIVLAVALASSVAAVPTAAHASPPTGVTASDTSGIASQDLATAGVGSPYYRIPALTTTTAGTLLAAYDARPTLGDLPSNIHIDLRRSTDGGRTWQTQQIVRSDPAPKGYGDPSLLVDGRTGRIFLFYAAGENQGFAGSATGNDPNDPNVLQADYSYSDDDGLTWQHRRITPEIKDPAWGGMFAASGQGIQVQRGPYAGRLIQQYVVRFNGANYAASAYSDDDGATWHMGQLVGPGMDENKTVELSDGRIMLNSRAKPARLVAYSSDGGETYTTPVPDPQLPDPADNGSIIRYNPAAAPSSPESRKLLFSNNESTTSRSNLVVKESCDNGLTWPIRRVVEPGPAAYSTLTRLPDGTFGLLWESKNYGAITYSSFGEDWLDGVCAPLTVSSPQGVTAGSTVPVQVTVTSEEQGAIAGGSVTLSGLPAGWSTGTVPVGHLARGGSATVEIPVTIPADTPTNAYAFRPVFASNKGQSTTPTDAHLLVHGGNVVWSDTIDRTFDGTGLADVSDAFPAISTLTGGSVTVHFRTSSVAPAAVLLSAADPISAYRDFVLSINNGTPYFEYRTSTSSYPVRITTSARVDDGADHELILASSDGTTSLILDGTLIGQSSGQAFFKNIDDITPVYPGLNPSGEPNLTLGANRAYVNGKLTNRWFYTGAITSVSVSDDQPRQAS